MTKRQEQKEKRRQDILIASLDVFVRKGFASAKISDIAQQLSMSVGLFFHYFPSKEAVYEELVRYGLGGTQSVMTLDTGDPLTFFTQAAAKIFKMLVEQPVVAKIFVLMSQSQYNEAVPQRAREMANQVNNIQRSVPLIEAGQKSGVFKQGDPLALSIAFWTAIQGVAEEIARHPEQPCPDPSWIVDIVRRKP